MSHLSLQLHISLICSHTLIDSHRFMVNYHDDFGGVEVQEKIEEAFVALRNVIRACGLEELHNDVNLV